MNKIFNEKATEYVSTFIDFLPKLGLAFLIFIVGLRIANKVSELIKVALEKTSLSVELKPFIISLLNACLKVVLFFVIAGIIGIETTKFVAVLGAAVFAIGMGLQGSLGHFAAGLLILIFRPYKVGEVVEIQGQLGIIREIQIINTHIELFDCKMAIIPNGIAISDIVVNHSYKGLVRVDTEISIPYSEDFPRIKKIITEAVSAFPLVLSKPEVFVGIKDFESHSVRILVWPFAKVENYWTVLFEVNELLKSLFHEHKVSVAYSEGVELGEIGK